MRLWIQSPLNSFLNGESPPWWSQKRQYAKFPPKSRMSWCFSPVLWLVGHTGRVWELAARAPSSRRHLQDLYSTLFLEVRASFLQRSSGATPWHLAAELSKTGLKHGPLGEERGQATHPQQRGGACSHEHSWVHGLQRQKIPGVHGVGRQKPWAV